MAVPTITSVTPSTGSAWGRDLVRIVGTGFADAGVAVTFGGAAAAVQGVVADDGAGGSYADVQTPRCPTQEPGAVAVALQNLDAGGAAVPGELVTLAGGYTYQRADLATESTLARLVRELIQSLRQQVVTEAGTPVHVDWQPDADGDGDVDADDNVRIIPVAKVPSITITGPATPKNLFLRRVERRLEVVAGTGGLQFVRRGPTITVDLVFTLTLVTESTVQLLNMMSAVAGWLNANPRMYIFAVKDDPTSGRVKWAMDHGDFRSATGPDKLRSATVDVTIRGFNLDEGLPLDRARLVDTVLVGAEQMED